MELAAMKTHTENTSRSRLHGIKLAALVLGSSLVLAGCAGNPPTEQYAVTQSAVNAAISAGGTEFAAVEMKSAQDKLKAAELAMHDEDYEKARRLAEQAEAIVEAGQADAVMIGRAALRNAEWALDALSQLGASGEELPYPDSYFRGWA